MKAHSGKVTDCILFFFFFFLFAFSFGGCSPLQGFDLGHYVLMLLLRERCPWGFLLEEDWDRIECGVTEGVVLVLTVAPDLSFLPIAVPSLPKGLLPGPQHRAL